MKNRKIEFKGTKGNWVYCKSEIDPKKYNFAIVGHYSTRLVADVYKRNGNEIEESEYNAQLIANAPAMFEMLKKAKARICSLKLSMLTHPDHESGSEFDDQTESSQELEDEIETLLINATKID